MIINPSPLKKYPRRWYSVEYVLEGTGRRVRQRYASEPQAKMALEEAQKDHPTATLVIYEPGEDF